TRTDFREDYNVAIADEPGETDIDKMLYVQVSSQYRADYGLATNPENLDKQIIVTDDLEQYHLHNGLKNPTAMNFTSEEPGEPVDLNTIEEARDQGSGTAKTKGFVIAKLKNPIKKQDETAAITVSPPSYDVNLGEEITLTGKLQNNRGRLPLDDAIFNENAGKQEVPEPLLLTGNELNEHKSKLAIMEEVTITEKEDGGTWPNYTATYPSEAEFLVRDEYNELALDVGATYDSITGIVSQ